MKRRISSDGKLPTGTSAVPGGSVACQRPISTDAPSWGVWGARTITTCITGMALLLALCGTSQAQGLVVQESFHSGGLGMGWRTTSFGATFGPGWYGHSWHGNSWHGGWHGSPWAGPTWGVSPFISHGGPFWRAGYPVMNGGFGHTTVIHNFTPAVYSVQNYRLGLPMVEPHCWDETELLPRAKPQLQEQGVGALGGGQLVNLKEINRPAPVGNAAGNAAAGANAVPHQAARPQPAPLAELNPNKPTEPTRPTLGSNAQAKQRCDYFLRSGDRLFGQQRYQESLARYKDAANAASDLAEPHVRKGLAYLATNRPDYAVESFRAALELDSAVLEQVPTLDVMLGGNGLAKSSFVEGVARRAVDNPQDPDLLFAVACVLIMDGQPEAAERYLAHVQRLTGQPQEVRTGGQSAVFGEGAIDL
ncbi:MAG: hypothetical protein WDZ51_04450 [Pirellulaceae bacterium]